MTPLRLTVARSGEPTATLGGRYLHSAYDPRSEADRFRAEHLAEVPATVILIGACLGYLTRSIRRARPDCRVLGLYLSPQTCRASVCRADEEWSPGSGGALHAFLSDRLLDVETAGLRVLEWPAAVTAFPQEAHEVRRTVVEVLRQKQASLVTEGRTGRAWIRNAVRNALYAPPVADLRRPPARIAACLVAAAGPSLEESMPTLRATRDRLVLIALGSAVAALLDADLVPDLVVTTEASSWAAVQLAPLLGLPRRLSRPPLAAPLSATTGITRHDPLLIFSQADPVEQPLLDCLAGDAPRPVYPPQGTVAATALAIARSLDSWPVVCAGLDFAWRAGRSHARPHLAHRYREERSTRVHPASGAVFEQLRSFTPIDAEWAADRTLSTYASWFRARALSSYAPLYSLNPSPATCGVPELNEKGIRALPRRYPTLTVHTVTDTPDRAGRRESVRRAMASMRAALPAAAPAEPFGHTRVSSLALALLQRLALPELLSWRRGESPWTAVLSAAVRELDALAEMTG